MSTISSFRSIETKQDVYKGVKVIWKKFSESLREHAMKIINFNKKEMKFLTKIPQKSFENARIFYIYKEIFENKYMGIQRWCLYNLKYNVSKNIHIVFRNWSNYDYHFIIKELAEEFKKQFTCLEENTEKYITLTVSIEKEVTRIDKNGEEITNKFYISTLIAQHSWQTPYQTLQIIFLK